MSNSESQQIGQHMNISIIGASRNRNGIGQYIANYFQKNQACVVSALGSTENSAYRAAQALKMYEINARAYNDFQKMIQREKPSAVVIASPLRTHYDYLSQSIDLGLHIFCEKPFFWQEKTDAMPARMDKLFEKAVSKKLTVAMNSQWPFSIPFYEELCGSLKGQTLTTFYMRLSPGCSGKEMILDSVPHALSLLYFVFGAGKINGLRIESRTAKKSIRFIYGAAIPKMDVLIELESQEHQPRSFQYGFNGKIINRVVDPANYDIYFQYQNRKIKIEDPLELSVRDFISAVSKQREPVIGKSHIVATTKLLNKIYHHTDREEESQ
jgi:predicted dehydrogenase